MRKPSTTLVLLCVLFVALSFFTIVRFEDVSMSLRTIGTPESPFSSISLLSPSSPHTRDVLFTLGIVSDTETESGGISPIFRTIESQMVDANVDAALHLGDASHRLLPEQYTTVHTFFQESPLTWYIVPGNHDLLQPWSTTGREYSGALFEEQFGSLRSLEKLHERLWLVRLNNADNTVGFSVEDLALLQDSLSRAAVTEPLPTVLIAIHRPVHVPGASALGVSDGTAGAADTSYDRFVQILSERDRRVPVSIVSGHIHTTLEYELGDVPVLITGGGGSEDNVSKFGLVSFPHWYRGELLSDGSLVFSLRSIHASLVR